MMHLHDAIYEHYLLDGLTLEQKDRIAAIAREKTVDGGEMLVRQFDRNTDLMLLLSGKIRITSFSGEVLAEFSAKSMLGEMSLLDDQPRSANAVAVGPTSIAILPGGLLKALMDDDPMLAAVIYRNVGKVLCQRLRAANIQIDGLMSRDG